MSCGMRRFCSMLNYNAPSYNQSNDVFAILTRGNHYYLYRNSDGQIVASNDQLTMDLWNIGKRSYLNGPVQCQLVIRSYAANLEEDFRQMVKKAKDSLSAKVGVRLEFDRIVNLHLPRYVDVTPSRIFDPNISQGHSGLVEHPIHKFMSIVVDRPAA